MWFASAAREGTHLTLATKKLNGESYQFSGELLKLGNLGVMIGNDQEVVLKGHLKKLHNGRIVSDSEVDLTYEMGG